MKPIQKIVIERKPGILGKLWLWGKPRFGVERKGVRRYYKGLLDIEITMPGGVRRVVLRGFGELICLQIVIYRGRIR